MNPLLILFFGIAPFIANAYVFPSTPSNLHLTTVSQNKYALAYQTTSTQYLQFINSSGKIIANLTAQGQLIENLGVSNDYLVYTSYSQSQLSLYTVEAYSASNTTQIPLISNIPQTPNKVIVSPLPLNSSYIALSLSITRFIGSFGYQTYSNLTSFKIPNGTQIYQQLDINIHTTTGIAFSANRLAVIGYQGGIVTQNISTPGDMYSVFSVTNPNTKASVYLSLIDYTKSSFSDATNFAVLLSNSTMQIFSEALGKITNTISLGIVQNKSNKCLPIDNNQFLAFACLDYASKIIYLYSGTNNFLPKKIVTGSSKILDFTVDPSQYLIIYATASQISSASFSF